MAAPVKVVLKSTTTMTLSDRFTEMAQKPLPKVTAKIGVRGGRGTRGNRASAVREEASAISRASAKNRRLAEQMSRRSGVTMVNDADNDELMLEAAPVRATQVRAAKQNIKQRLDRSQIKSDVKDRLGTVIGGGVSWKPRGSITRAGFRGASSNRGASQRGSARGRGAGFQSRGGFQTRGTNRGGFNSTRGGGSGNRGGRGRGGRGGRGGQNNNTPVDASELDNDLESYMNPSK